MPRSARHAIGGLVYHVLNRANARRRLFDSTADYRAFENVLIEAFRRYQTRLLAYCIMPNHWHLVLWPREDGELSQYVGWLTATHAQRWHAFRRTAGAGHVYQGRFKSFPVETDEHFLTVCRYVERNAVRAGLVGRAEDWRWSSLWRRVQPHRREMFLLASWPVRPSNLEEWLKLVNTSQTEEELRAVRCCVEHGTPFGGDEWSDRIAQELGLKLHPRAPGRPRRGPEPSS